MTTNTGHLPGLQNEIQVKGSQSAGYTVLLSSKVVSTRLLLMSNKLRFRLIAMLDLSPRAKSRWKILGWVAMCTGSEDEVAEGVASRSRRFGEILGRLLIARATLAGEIWGKCVQEQLSGRWISPWIPSAARNPWNLIVTLTNRPIKDKPLILFFDSRFRPSKEFIIRNL